MLKSNFKNLIFLFLLFNHVFAIAQDWESIFHFQSNGTFAVLKIINDDVNNVYVSGYFLGSYDIYNSHGARDLYVAKLSPEKTLLWFKQIGGKGIDNFLDITLRDNVLYFVGGLMDTIFIGTTDTLVLTPSVRNTALIKFTSDGSCILKKNIAISNTNNNPSSIVFDNSNNLIITGTYLNQVNFDGNSFTQIGTHNFILKLDQNGQFIWAKNITGSNISTRFTNVKASTDGYYFNGYFRDQLNLDIDTITSYAANFSDLFLYKTDINGNGLWVRRSRGNNIDISGSLADDAFGNVYFSGYFRSPILTFDSTATLQSLNPLQNKGNNDIFIVKYNKNGILQWAKSYGSSNPEYAVSIEEKNNFLYLSGYYTGELIFGQDTLTGNSPSDTNMFIGTFDLQGNRLKSTQIKGSDSRKDISDAIFVDINNNIYITGYFKSSILYVGESSLVNNNPGSFDGLVARYTPPYSAVFTTVNNLKCSDDNSGSLKVTPYFGVPPFTYQWSHAPSSGIDDSIASGLSAGLYSVTVTDSRDSVAVATITITQPLPLSAPGIITDVSCYNGSNGAIDVTPTGGTLPYTYSWTSPDGSGINPTAQDQLNINRGTYILTLKDKNLCQRKDTFIVTQPQPITFGNSMVADVTIPPGSNGAIDLTVSGGTAPYGYSWTGPASFTSSDEDISGLNGGNYLINITDNNGCSGDTLFIVFDQTILIAQVTAKTDVTCNGSANGSATITVLNGAYPYTYNWSDGPNSVGDSVLVRTNMSGGLYYVTVTDNDAKTAQTSVQINEPSAPVSLLLNSFPLRCNNDNSGVLNLTVSGGTLPYSFNWSNGSTTEDLVNVAAANYSVTVTDSKGCTETGSEQITQPPAISLTIIPDPINRNYCYGDLNAEAFANAGGGTAPLSYLWNDPGGQITPTATGLGAGLYTVTVNDANLCFITNQVNITEPDQILAVPAYLLPSCTGDSDGRITPAVSGGTPAFDYQWNTGWNQRVIDNIGAGDYSLTITDAFNCVNEFDFFLDEPSPLTYQSVSLTDATCYGYDDGTITIGAAGGTGSYRYSVDGGTEYSANPVLEVPAGDYTLRIMDDNACESPDSLVSIDQPAGIIIGSEEVQDISCHGAGDGAITISASGGAANLRYSIDGGNAFFDNNGIFTGLPGGDYSVVVTDDECEIPGSLLSITDPGLLIIDTTEVSHQTGTLDGAIVLDYTGGTEPVTFILQPEGSDSLTSATGEFTGLQAGQYEVYAIDTNLCESNTLDVNILLTNGSNLVIYDAFSPNGDGINEVWNIGNIGTYPGSTVKIYNVWGIEVFSSGGYSQPWDGTYNGKELPSGTYYYVIDPGDGSEVLTGPVNIVK